ncbi:MAG: hypothetical protein WC551_10770 [Patescibacteria group bacterium]|jgi:hypothetical protein
MKYLLTIAFLMVATAAYADDTVAVRWWLDDTVAVRWWLDDVSCTVTVMVMEDTNTAVLYARITALERKVANIECRLAAQQMIPPLTRPMPIPEWWPDTWGVPAPYHIETIPCEVAR